MTINFVVMWGFGSIHAFAGSDHDDARGGADPSDRPKRSAGQDSRFPKREKRMSFDEINADLHAGKMMALYEQKAGHQLDMGDRLEISAQLLRLRRDVREAYVDRTATLLGSETASGLWVYVLRALIDLGDSRKADSLSLHLRHYGPYTRSQLQAVFQLHQGLTLERSDAIRRAQSAVLPWQPNPAHDPTYFDVATALLRCKNLDYVVAYVPSLIKAMQSCRPLIPLIECFDSAKDTADAKDMFDFVNAVCSFGDPRSISVIDACTLAAQFHSAAERLAVIGYAEDLMRNKSDKAGVLKLMGQFVGLPEESQRNLFDAAKPFVPLLNSDRAIPSVVRILAPLDKRVQASQVAQAFHFLDNKILLISVLSHLGECREQDFDQIKKMGAAFLPPSANMQLISRFFFVMQNVQRADQETLYGGCEGMTPAQRQDIMRFLLKLDVSSMMTLYSLLPSFISDTSGASDLYGMLMALLNTQSLEEEEVRIDAIDELRRSDEDNAEQTYRHSNTNASVRVLFGLLNKLELSFETAMTEVERYADQMLVERKLTEHDKILLTKLLHGGAPLLDDDRPTIVDNKVYLKEDDRDVTMGQIFASVWHVAKNIKDYATRESADAEMDKRQEAFVKILTQCFELDGRRVCDNGKTQRLLSVLQGYVPNVKVDSLIEVEGVFRGSLHEVLRTISLQAFDEATRQPKISLSVFDEIVADVSQRLFPLGHPDATGFQEGVSNMRGMFPAEADAAQLLPSLEANEEEFDDLD